MPRSSPVSSHFQTTSNDQNLKHASLGSDHLGLRYQRGQKHTEAILVKFYIYMSTVYIYMVAHVGTVQVCAKMHILMHTMYTCLYYSRRDYRLVFFSRSPPGPTPNNRHAATKVV